MPMPSANGNISIMDKEFGTNSKKTTEELKRQVAKLKADLESERSKLKQVHRDKTAEVKRVQENHEKERHRLVENVTKRLQSEHAVELRRVRETLGKEKDNELRQVLKFKEEELKALKQQINEEKERSKRAEDDIRRHNSDRNKANSSEIEHRLRDDISDLKEQKRKLDELYKLKCAADYEKAELIRRLKSEHEREVNSLIRESKREVAKEFQHLRSAEKALEEKNHELAFKDQLTRKLEAEKHETRQRKTSADSTLSDSPFRSRLGSGTQETSLSEILPETDEVFQSSPKGRYDKERELRKKNADLQSRLDQLEKKCSMLEKENASKHAGSHKASGIVEEKVKKLKKRNSELVSIARQLEERAKKLQEEKNATLKQANSKADPSAEVEHMKKMFARQRAKDLAEQAKSHLQKDNEIENLRSQLESLSVVEPKTQSDKVDELQAIIKQTAKERLILEKKLSAIDPNSSLSSDGSVRLATYSKTKSSGVESLQKDLEMKEKECEQLRKSAEEMKSKCSKLELEREKFAAKCTMLHQKNSELGKRMKDLNKLEEEIKSLKDNLKIAEERRHSLEQECLKLREHLKDLMHVKEDLEASEKQRKVLERENVTSVSRLKEREEEIRQLHKIQEESTRVQRLAVTSLENDVRALQQKCADSNDRANNLKNELEILRSSKAITQNKSTQTSLAKDLLRHESRDNQGKARKTGNDGSDSSGKDILDVAASRIQQLEMSDSEEDSLSASHVTNVNTKPEDDIDILSRRINQASLSDDSMLDDNDESDASRDVNSMAEGDLADMEDNDVTASMLDGDETGNNLIGYLDNNKNISKGKRIPNKVISNNNSNKESPEDQSIDERYLTQDSETESDIDDENLSVFIARYSYDPYQHSPNDCPDAELAFQAGDYLYIFGDIDEDGFYLGELMDGQRGLVPSNFVEKIADESEMPWIANGDQDDLDGDYGSDEEQNERRLHRNLRLNVEHIPDSNLGDIEEVDEESREALNSSHDGFRSDDTDLEPIRIPSPKHVILERQHTRSIVLNWKPADLPVDEVKGYGVYVNGELRMMVKGGNSTKALIENIDPTKTYRVSVRTITVLGEQSNDQEATLTIGKDASVAPSNIQVSEVSPTSAKIEWLPGNSSYSHEIIVNGTPLRSIKPGTYQYTITNLEPKEHYRVHIRAKNPKIFLDEDSKDIEKDLLVKAVEFTTLEGGAPDPPLNVHLVPNSSRSGPNTLEVNWIPVTITEQGTSNGARVTGYKVYINDVACGEATSPTADCVTVASWMIERAVKKTKAETVRLTARTQSSHGESVPSNVVTIPIHTFNFHMNKLIGAQPVGTPVKPKSSELKNQDESLSSLEKDKKEAVTPIAKPRQGVLTPPVPKTRTKGKPVLWKVDIEEDDSIDDRSGGNSTMDEDEQVEICHVKSTNNNQTNYITNELNMKQELQTSGGTPLNNNVKHDTKPELHDAPTVSLKNSRSNEKDIKQELESSGETRLNNNIKHDKKQDLHASAPTNLKNDDQRATKQALDASAGTYKDDQHNSKQDLSVEEDKKTKEKDEVDTREDTSKSDTPERKISGLSDIDVDELANSLKSATSYKRDKKSKPRPQAKEPILTPIDDSGSEIGNSSDDSLSVIDEEEEDTYEEIEGEISANKRSSRSSRTQSATDSFRSDDDVMDLLDDELEENNVHALTAANVRKFSQEQKMTDNQESIPVSDNEHRLMKYLVNSEEKAKSSDGTEIDNERSSKYLVNSNDHPQTDVVREEAPPYENNEERLMKYLVNTGEKHQDNINVENEDQVKDQTYSDAEADQFEPEPPQGTSTPTVPMVESEDNDNDKVADTTYTVEDSEPNPEDNQEEIVRIFIALYDYNPAIQSPNPDAEEEELAFNEGDLIKIYGDIDPDGFYWGEMDGRAGFVPHNMVSEVQVDEDDLLDQSPSPLPESQANDNYPHSAEVPKPLGTAFQNNHTNEGPNPHQQSAPHHSNMDPNDHTYPSDNVPGSQYVVIDNEIEQLPIEGKHPQYPKVIVHKPSDASLHEPQFRKDLNQDDPHDVSNDTYTVSEADDSSGYEDPRNSLNYSLEPRKMVALFDYDPQMLSPNPDSEVELKFRSGDILYVYGEMDEDGFYTGEINGVRGLVPSNFLEEFNDSSAQSTQEPPSDVSGLSEESTPGPSKPLNGTQSSKEETAKKKKGIFSKGKQMLKKMTKGQTSKK